MTDTDRVKWSVVTTTTKVTAFSDGTQEAESVTRKQSASEEADLPPKPSEGIEVGDWDLKHPFSYTHTLEGGDNMIGQGGDQDPGHDAKHGVSWKVPLGWGLNRGSSSGDMYLSGYIPGTTEMQFMDFPQRASTQPGNNYKEGDPTWTGSNDTTLVASI